MAAARAASQSISSVLFGLTPTDPLTYACVGVLLMTVAAIACVVPAFRASRVEPTRALRTK